MRNVLKKIHILVLLGMIFCLYSLPSSAEEAGNAIGSTSLLSKEDQMILEKLTNTMTAKLSNQIILVVDHDLMLWTKDTAGNWSKKLDTYCGYGRNGLKAFNIRQEGDGTTPIGSFPILFSFGFGQNPGTAMTYREIQPTSYWSAEESTYNTWVESATQIDGEHLSEYTICYKKAMAIGFNQNPTVYKRGSAIFLHLKNPAHWSTSGCVAVEEEAMNTLLSTCQDGTYIMIVPDINWIQNF